MIFVLRKSYDYNETYFVFICGIVMLQSIGIKKKLSNKKEFLQKVNEILQED